MFKPFYIHEIVKYDKPGANGFTAYIEPSDDPRTVKFRVVVCSNKDPFCKKTGREEVDKKTFELVNIRELTELLAEYYIKVNYSKIYRNWNDKNYNTLIRHQSSKYNYIYKYMV